MAKKKDYQADLLEGQAVAVAEPEEQDTVPSAAAEDTVSPEPVVATPETKETPVAEEPKNEFLSKLSEFGFEGVETEEDAKQRILDAYRQQQEELESAKQERERLEQLARYGNEYLAQMQRERIQQRPEPAQETKGWWEPPKFDLAWVQKYRELDPETQAPRWKRDTPAQVVSAAESYERFIDEWTTGLTTRPNEVLPPAIFGILESNQDKVREILKPLMEDYYQQRRQEETTTTFVDQIRKDNSDWLFEKDPRTNTPTNKLTRDGKVVIDYVNEAERMGITDPREQWKYATSMYRLSALEADEKVKTQSDAAREVATQRRREHTRRAATTPSRGGSVSRETEPARRTQNRNARPGEELLRQMEEDGVL